jgi:hypothetical protein
MYERGLLENVAWTRVIDEDIEFEFSYPYGRAYWKLVRESTTFPQEFVEYVDSKLAKGPYNFHKTSYEAQLSLVKEIQAKHDEESLQSSQSSVE